MNGPSKTSWRRWMKHAKKKLKKVECPPDGSMVSLFYQNGSRSARYHVQIEYVHDGRCTPSKQIVGFAWDSEGNRFVSSHEV